MRAGIRLVIVGSLLASTPLPVLAGSPDHGVEIGAGVGVVGSQWTGRFSGGDLRLSIPVDARGDVEALVALQSGGGDRLGFYGAQYKQRLKRSTASGFQPFLSYGAIGIFYLEDGERMITAPFLGLVGGGIEQRVTRYFSVRLEAQAVTLLVIPLAARVAAGVSVPIGHSPR
jgi:hypothetical protein